MLSTLSRNWGVAALVALSATPALVAAQRGGRGGPRDLGPNSVSPLIDMRRELDLTPRQVATLDSIERALGQRNRTLSERLRTRRDSLLANRNLRDLSAEDRQALRARLDSLAPLRNEFLRDDSTARAAALRVLSDSQRVRVREFQAERRGFAMGQMTGRGDRGLGQGGSGRGFGPGQFGRRGGMGSRGFRGPRGRFDGMGPQGFGPRMRRGFGDGMGPGGMGPGGMGPGRMGRGRMGFEGMGPQGMRPDGARGRMGAPGAGMRGRMMRPDDDPMSGAAPRDFNAPAERMGPRFRGRLGPQSDSLRTDSVPPRRPRRPPSP